MGMDGKFPQAKHGALSYFLTLPLSLNIRRIRLIRILEKSYACRVYLSQYEDDINLWAGV